MPFVSELNNRPVVDVDGELVGTLNDVLAVQKGEVPHPVVTAIIVKTRSGPLTISITNVAALFSPVIPLNKRGSEIAATQPEESNALFLVRDVLDKQIIDINGVRVVRVNDLELTRVNGEVYVSNVDIGGLGLIRRMGLSGLSRRLGTRPLSGKPGGIISWDDVELIAGDQPMRLKVPQEKLADLHPADLAEIISDLNRTEGSKFLESLDVKVAADALEEVEPDFQASLIESMDNEKVADVLEEMAPDEAADLLAELPEDRSKELLSLMQTDEANDVRRLLAYPDTSAGGIMNTEFIAVHPNMTAEQATKVIRETAHEAETIYYIYVVEKDNRLVGVFSLRQLVLSQPGTLVKDFMEDRIISVNLLDSQDETARVVSKYNLLAVPVVDEQKHLHGIVTADDALDKIIPTAWKKRLPRLYH
jgi:magnesium transporter